MKRVLRSCLDPLPRILSTRGLAAIVALVVSGTALSVYEYLESSRVPERAWPKGRPAAAAPEAFRGKAPRCASAQRCAPVAVPSAPSAQSAPTTSASSTGPDATVYRPEPPSSSSGS